MQVALTGASGFIGSFIVRELHAKGHRVTALVRATSRREHIEDAVDRFVIGNQADASCWDELLDGADGVIHNSADWEPLGGYGGIPKPADFARHIERNLASSLNLLRCSAPRPFVFMSTIAVHHDMRSRWGGEIDEDHPLRPATAYGAYKAAVEAHLWAEHLGANRHTAAIRPSGVYGIDPNLPRSYGYTLVRKIKRGNEPLDRTGGGKFIHVEDVAQAAVAALTRPEAAGCAFNLADCYARWCDWAQMSCELLGVSREIDMSSPTVPKNVFLKEQTMQVLGVAMDRGHGGIRAHLRELIAVMESEPTRV